MRFPRRSGQRPAHRQPYLPTPNATAEPVHCLRALEHGPGTLAMLDFSSFFVAEFIQDADPDSARPTDTALFHPLSPQLGKLPNATKRERERERGRPPAPLSYPRCSKPNHVAHNVSL